LKVLHRELGLSDRELAEIIVEIAEILSEYGNDVDLIKKLTETYKDNLKKLGLALFVAGRYSGMAIFSSAPYEGMVTLRNMTRIISELVNGKPKEEIIREVEDEIRYQVKTMESEKYTHEYFW